MSLPATLKASITLDGVDRAIQKAEEFAAKLGASEAAAQKVAGALSQLAVVGGIAFAGIREAMADETTIARLEAFTGGLKQAEKVMAAIDSLGQSGVFPKGEIEQAAMTMEKSLGGSFEKNIGLLETLGARMGSVAQAAELLARLQRGQTFGLVGALGDSGIGPDKLRAAGLDVQGRNIKNSPAEIIQALSAIAAADQTFGRLSQTTAARWEAIKDTVWETVEGIGKPLLGPLQVALNVVNKLLGVFKSINDFTGGWAANIALAGVAINGIGKLAPVLAVVVGHMKDLVKWQTVYSALSTAWTSVAATAGRMIGFLRAMLTIEKALAAVTLIRAVAASAIAAMMGNMVPIAILAGAGLAAVGGIHAINSIGNEREKQKAMGTPSAERPHRRDDTERLYEKMYGRSWTG